MERKDNEELDLGMLYDKLKQIYHAFLVFLYGLLQFVLSSWIIILVLLVIGIGYGIYKDANANKGRETELIVQINYGAANLIYDAATQLDLKIKERDTSLLKPMGLYNNEVFYLSGIEMEPIVSVMDIISNTRENDRNLEVILDEAQYEDELLTSDVFLPAYKMHRIKLHTSPWSNQGTIDRFVDYLNGNESLNRLKETAKQNLRYRIDENKKSVAYMDSLFKAYGTNPENRKSEREGDVTFFDINLTNLHLVFQEKGLIMQKNQELEIELANATDTVVVLNKPMLTQKQSFLGKKRIIYPITLLFLFFMVSFAIYLFKKAKQLSEAR